MRNRRELSDADVKIQAEACFRYIRAAIFVALGEADDEPESQVKGITYMTPLDGEK